MKQVFRRVATRSWSVRTGVKVLSLAVALTAFSPVLPDGGVPVGTAISAQSRGHKLVIRFWLWKICTSYACHSDAPDCCGPVKF